MLSCEPKIFFLNNFAPLLVFFHQQDVRQQLVTMYSIKLVCCSYLVKGLNLVKKVQFLFSSIRVKKKPASRC